MRLQTHKNEFKCDDTQVRSLDKYNSKESYQSQQIGKKVISYSQRQKENVGITSSFISLKPFQKSSSKTNLLINPNHTKILPQYNPTLPLL